MKTAIIIVIIVIAVLVIAAVVSMLARRRRSDSLRQRFGPEYERAVEGAEGRREAEQDLRQREKQRSELQIRPLPEAARVRYIEEWNDIQARFVDEPSTAVEAAGGLLNRVMIARGYPMDDFDSQADLVSVDHPEVVENYRAAHQVHLENRAKRASTEDLREALLRYRSLFDELLRAGADGKTTITDDGEQRRDQSTGRSR
jgi:hypothetical protein